MDCMKDINKTGGDSSVHEFNLNLISEYFSGIKRQGPGNDESTKKALGFIEGLNKNSKIIDIGCGTGGPTMALAKNTSGKIVGLDLFPKFVDIFNRNFSKLKNRVKGIVGSMDNLPFKNEEFDLIWSEGAIYNIGFQRGLKEWKKFLKKNGYVAITEVSWFTEERPEEIEEFWNNAYGEMDTIPNKVRQMQNAGYLPVATFVLPEECWTKNFFAPQVAVQKKFLKKYKGHKTAEDLVKNQKHEAELYAKYKKYYGYVFYIGKKI